MKGHLRWQRLVPLLLPVLAVLLTFAPASVVAGRPASLASTAFDVPIDANFSPPQATPGTLVLVDAFGQLCNGPIGPDLVWFTQDIDGQQPFLVSTDLGHADGNLRSFVVPDLPAGVYYLVAECSDRDGLPCCQFGPGFTVLDVPNTATAPVLPHETGPLEWAFIVVAGVLGAAMALSRNGATPRRRIG